MIRRYITFTILIGLMGAFLGCGDSSTDSDPGDAPDVPIKAVEKSQPDVSYFQGTGGAPKASYQSKSSANFNNARSAVLNFNSFTIIGQTYISYFQSAQGNNASFNNGVWEWKYNHSGAQRSVEFRLTAEDVSNGYNWDMYYTINSPEVSVNDYNVVSGFVNKNSKKGDWTFNVLPTGSGSETPLLKTDWEVISSSEKNIDITVYDQGQSTDTINYTENGDIHKMVVNPSSVTVYWDVGQDIGYIIDDKGVKRCWSGSGSNATNASCSSVNL